MLRSLVEGWYDLESDGVRNFRWSSSRSVIPLSGEKNTVKLLMGTDVSDRTIMFVFSDGAKYEILSRSGWHNYCVPYSGQDSLVIETETFTPSKDTRKLGMMLSKVSFSDETRDAKEAYFATQFSINKLKSRYIDVVYQLARPSVSKILIRDTDSGKEDEFSVVNGGDRMICYETDSEESCNFEIYTEPNADISIRSVVNRKDYHDFLGLSEHVSEKDHWKYDELQQKDELSIQWFLTWKCNYTCGYCWQEVSKELYRYSKWERMDPTIWAEAFNKLKPHALYFTGGEPTLYKNLPDLISMLDKKAILSITTNFGPTFNLNKWREKVKPGRVTGFWASFHPTQLKDADEFFRKADDYISHYGNEGFGLEIVLHKENLGYKDRFIDFCQSRKIQYSVDPFVPQYAEDTGGMTDTKNLTEQDDNNRAEKRYDRLPVVQETAGLARERVCDINSSRKVDFSKRVTTPIDLDLKLDNTTEDRGRLPVFCPAGTSRINVDMRGDAYTCMSAIDRGKLFKPHSLPHYKTIGNILDEDFKLMDKPVMCWESFRCSACDFEMVDYFWEPINDNFNYQLPLPE